MTFSYAAKCFAIIGLLTVGIDFLSYQFFMIFLGVDVHLSKTIGFLSGTLFSYAANKQWTFSSGHSMDKKSFFRFLLLYLFTLQINVYTNFLIIHLLPPSSNQKICAFFVATLFSATLNFYGMKNWVFVASQTNKKGNVI